MMNRFAKRIEAEQNQEQMEPSRAALAQKIASRAPRYTGSYVNQQAIDSFEKEYAAFINALKAEKEPVVEEKIEPVVEENVEPVVEDVVEPVVTAKKSYKKKIEVSEEEI